MDAKHIVEFPLKDFVFLALDSIFDFRFCSLADCQMARFKDLQVDKEAELQR